MRLRVISRLRPAEIQGFCPQWGEIPHEWLFAPPAGRPGRTLHLPRNFAPGYALCAQPAYSGVVHDLFRTPEALSLGPRVAEASFHALEAPLGPRHRQAIPAWMA